MPYASLPTVVTPNPITEAWGNQVKANFDASPNGLATTGGQIPYATGSGGLAMLAPGPTPLAVLRLNSSLAAPEWWPIPVDPVTTVPGLRTLGPGAQQAAAGNDARLSDARPPTGAAGGALAGSYPSPTLAPGAIGTAQILDNAVTAAKIADGNVTTGKLVAGGVYPINVTGTAAGGAPPTGPAGGSLGGSYPNPTLAAASVGTSQLVDSSVTSAKLVSGGTYPINVTGSAGSAGTSGSAPPSGAAGGSLAGSYPNPSLAANSVAAAQIVDGSVGTAELADGNVTNAKLVASGTYTIHITGNAGGAPPTGVAGGALTGTYPNPGLAGGLYAISITGTAGGAPPTGAAGGSLAGSYPNPSIAANAIGTAQIVNGTVTGAKLEDIAFPVTVPASGTSVPIVQIDAKGRVASLTSTPVSVAAANLQAGAVGPPALSLPSVYGYTNAIQTVGPLATIAITFHAKVWDTNGMLSAPSTLITAQIAGVYQVDGNVAMEAPLSGAPIEIYLRYRASGGSTVITSAVSLSAGDTGISGIVYAPINQAMKLNVGDSVELVIFNSHNATGRQVFGGSPAKTATHLSATWVSAG